MNKEYKIDEQLAKELFNNEQIRLRFVSAIAFVALVMFSIFTWFQIHDKRIISSNSAIIYFSTILLMLVVREIVILKFFLPKIYSKNNKRIVFLRYFNLVFEISVPTALLVVFIIFVKSNFVLSSPVLTIYFLIIILTIFNLDFKISFYSGLLASIQYLLVVYITLNITEPTTDNSPISSFTFYIGKGVALFLAGIVAGYIGYLLKAKIKKTISLLDETNNIKKIFGQQISNEIVTELLNKKDKIEPEKKFVAIMFVDIRDFTPFAEKKEPEEIIEYQNQIFSFMADTIIKHNGIINQFLGDGYMATFGAPISSVNDCQNAINAALEILTELKRKNEAKEIPFTKIGIGLHAGNVVAGNVGSKNRQQYSISGNTVIISARIEQLTKTYKNSLLISEELLEKLYKFSNQFNLVGPVQIKGREEPVQIYKWNKGN